MPSKTNIIEYSTPEQEFVITRIINAPRELVFKAWTSPVYLAAWWGPKSFTNPQCNIDLKEDGAYSITMRSPDGEDFPMGGVFREIEAPKHLVMTVDCSQHPAMWHEMVNKYRPGKGVLPEFYWTVTFEEYEDSKTKLTVCLHFESDTDRDALLNIGMSEGWTESLEMLEDILVKD